MAPSVMKLRVLVGQDLDSRPDRSPLEQEARPVSRIVARRKGSLVFLQPSEIWAFQAAGRLAFVHSTQGRFDIDLSLAEIDASFYRPLTRVHRNWLVNVTHVRAFERESGQAWLFVGSGLGAGSDGVRVPVSRDRAHEVREMLLANATGVRHLARHEGDR